MTTRFLLPLLLCGGIAACWDLPEPTGSASAPQPPPPASHSKYVAAGGLPTGDGTETAPWDMATALAGAGGRVRPGDTIWVGAGMYQPPFEVSVGGTDSAPVVIRARPGQRAIIDGAVTSEDNFVVSAAWTVLWGLEFTNSGTDRTIVRSHAVVNDAPHTRYVNLIIHDAGMAFFAYPQYSDVVVYGSVIYNCGFLQPTRSNGHALYLKSATGPLVILDNVMFNQFGYGIHAYADRGTGPIRGVTISGNVSFDNGILAPQYPASNLLVGGQDPADDVTVRDNLTWYPADLNSRYATNALYATARFGFQAFANGGIVVRDNQFIGGDPVVDVGTWRQATMTENLFAGDDDIVRLRDTVLAGFVWSDNTYIRDPSADAWSIAGVGLPLPAWQAVTGLGTADVATSQQPAEPYILVRPNVYEAGRGMIAVVNWSEQAVVNVDLKGVVPWGGSFDVRNVQDLFGVPVVSGRYVGDPIGLPMTGVPPPVAVGMPASSAFRTAPAFDAFIVTTAQRGPP